MEGATLEVSNRVKALDRANAPLDELFDFVPDDNVHWIYRASQWNNTWKGTCTFTKHEAVELILYPESTTFRISLLEYYVPRWAKENTTKQGVVFAGLWDWEHNGSKPLNVHGTRWWTVLVTSVFGSFPDNDDAYTYLEKTSDISIVNCLAPKIEISDTGAFTETRFRSDVHVAECGFVNTLENGTVYQANAAGGSYVNAANFINGVSFLITFRFLT